MGCFGSKHVRDDSSFTSPTMVSAGVYSGSSLVTQASRRQASNASSALADRCGPSTTFSGYSGSLCDVRNISSLVSKTKLQPTRCNGSSDIYEGVLRSNGQKLAIRALRFPDMPGVASDGNSLPAKIQRRLLQNTRLWTVAPHSRIVPCLGYAMIDSMPCIITPWYANGSVDAYLEGDTRRDRLALIAQIADGLDYLHMKGVVHGDLKPSKILINDSGQAMLTDFGLARLLEETRTGLTTANSSALAIRYSSPERLQGEEADPRSDVYSFGCVALEILTGKAPFHALTSPSAVAVAKIKGTSPSHNHIQDFARNDPFRNLLNRCWHQDASQRPSMAEVVRELRKLGVKT